MSVTVVYFGGPMHGDVHRSQFDLWDLPEGVNFPVANVREQKFGIARYVPVVEADTPGRVVYMFDEETSTCD